MDGAGQLKHLRRFLIEKEWSTWELFPEFIQSGRGEGELEKLAVKVGNTVMVYFPDNSSCKISNFGIKKTVCWYNTETGKLIESTVNDENEYSPPGDLLDGVLILTYNL
jgi:hypothetical protein